MATGTAPYPEVNTIPYCGACGYPQIESPNLQNANDVFCNSCGADIIAFGFTALVPPTTLVATGGSLEVVFTFVVNPEADSTDIATQIDSGEPVLQEGVTSPVTIVAAEGETVAGVVRSVSNGIPGPWSDSAEDIATA